ncbi:MAG TPA: hypothetical protein VK838_04360 [Candidatus Limnocylindrales bacterium]|nr:hypothetical protein [Candidatus Limnocylindrales bacterium]
MRRAITAFLGAGVLLVAVSATALAGGPPGIGFYVDGQLYRTVGTPTDFSNTGAPDSTYDKIFALGGDLRNVAEAKPGDRDYNGGRWMVLPITWIQQPHQLTSAEEVYAARDAGELTIATVPAKQFLCPVIPLSSNGD